MIGVASAESTAIGDPLRARKNRGKTSGVVNWSGVDCPVARVWTSAEYIKARFVRFLMLRPVLALAVRDGREPRSGLVLPPLRHPAPSSPTQPPRGGKFAVPPLRLDLFRIKVSYSASRPRLLETQPGRGCTLSPFPHVFPCHSLPPM